MLHPSKNTVLLPRKIVVVPRKILHKFIILQTISITNPNARAQTVNPPNRNPTKMTLRSALLLLWLQLSTIVLALRRPLTVTTYNVWQMPQIFQTFSSTVISPDGAKRAPYIAQFLNSKDADIVVVTEAFDNFQFSPIWGSEYPSGIWNAMQRSSGKKWHRTGPLGQKANSYGFSPLRTFWSKAASDARGLSRVVGLTSGVVIMWQSDLFEQLETDCYVFKACNGGDCMALKGVEYAKLKVAGSDGTIIHVFGTHMQAEYATWEVRQSLGKDTENGKVRMKQIDELGEFMDSKEVGVNDLVILAGDLNIDSLHPAVGRLEEKDTAGKSEYRKALATLQMTDSVPKNQATLDKAFSSYDMSQNCMAFLQEADQPVDHWRERLDHVWYRVGPRDVVGGERPVKWRRLEGPLSVKTLAAVIDRPTKLDFDKDVPTVAKKGLLSRKDSELSGGFDFGGRLCSDLSDHYPLTVRMEIGAGRGC